MPNQRDRILVLHEQGMPNCDIARTIGAAPPYLRRTIKRFQELDHTGDGPRSGRKSTINTTRNRQVIEKRSNEIRVSMRRIACGTIISLESVPRIAKQVLQLKPYKLQRIQLLAADNSVYDWKDVDDCLVTSHP